MAGTTEPPEGWLANLKKTANVPDAQQLEWLSAKIEFSPTMEDGSRTRHSVVIPVVNCWALGRARALGWHELRLNQIIPRNLARDRASPHRGGKAKGYAENRHRGNAARFKHLRRLGRCNPEEAHRQEARALPPVRRRGL